MLNFDMDLFPSFPSSIRAKWCPIFLSPIVGSYEKLVVGVAVVSDDNYHVEVANRLEKLTCLYGINAEGLIYAVNIAVNHLKEELSLRGVEALSAPVSIVSAITVGDIREGRGENLIEIGKNWLSGLSSLHEVASVYSSANDDFDRLGSADKLPSLIFSYVTNKKSGLIPFFRKDIREGRRRLVQNHNVLIDFSGSRIVANFGTLRAGSITKSVNTVKHRLWDLKVNRDETRETFLVRDYEMIIQVPKEDDRQITPRQYKNVIEALDALEEQADKEELRLCPLSTVAEIGDRIVQAEAA